MFVVPNCKYDILKLHKYTLIYKSFEDTNAKRLREKVNKNELLQFFYCRDKIIFRTRTLLSQKLNTVSRTNHKFYYQKGRHLTIIVCISYHQKDIILYRYLPRCGTTTLISISCINNVIFQSKIRTFAFCSTLRSIHVNTKNSRC